MQNNTIKFPNLKGGQVVTQQVKDGVAIWGYNFEKGRPVNFGTVRGDTYEKEAGILLKPERSFCLTETEYPAVLEAGAVYLVCIPNDKSGSYAIELERFGRYSVPYFNARYGRQLRCALTRFEPSKQVRRRNARLDNPPVPVARDIIQERRERQLPFGW
jgi:hypothetical protein